MAIGKKLLFCCMLGGWDERCSGQDAFAALRTGMEGGKIAFPMLTDIPMRDAE